MVDREPPVVTSPPTRSHFLDVVVIPAEIVVAGMHIQAIGIPYAAVQFGGDRALAAAKTTGERMSRAGLPDPMSIIVREVETVKDITGFDSGSAIAAVFITAALLGADAGRRFRRAIGRR